MVCKETAVYPAVVWARLGEESGWASHIVLFAVEILSSETPRGLLLFLTGLNLTPQLPAASREPETAACVCPTGALNQLHVSQQEQIEE